MTTPIGWLLGWPLTVGTFVLVHPIGRLFRFFPQSEPSLRILSLGIVFLFANSFAASPIADAFEQRLATKVAARLSADPHA